MHYPGYNYIGAASPIPGFPAIPIPAQQAPAPAPPIQNDPGPGPGPVPPQPSDAEAISASQALITRTSPEAQKQIYDLWRHTQGGTQAYNKEAYVYAGIAAGAGLFVGVMATMLLAKKRR